MTQYKRVRDLTNPLAASVFDTAVKKAGKKAAAAKKISKVAKGVTKKKYDPKKHNVSGQIKKGLDKKKKAKEDEIKKMEESQRRKKKRFDELQRPKPKRKNRPDDVLDKYLTTKRKQPNTAPRKKPKY
tara:strand:+ start:2010 stop:2393 length:384 start_codon:yes stop_codon:yes gene_type:complete